MKLRLHVHRVRSGGWCADIDDDNDRQPDDPYWCVDAWPTLESALAAGCARLAELSRTTAPSRVSGYYEPALAA
ncbi:MULTISPECIES: hypothetical protein [Kribbella]|jgi:hypothetical protein|uniref:Uncharacterized protein n=1 Tax=Kribbella pratensis TaxID=2512112 RepID=A0ABY2FQ64_9ACTN|nr:MULTISPECIES: hypothetical protein [Kribbella]TDW95263.1 hypothetical protein EV137_2597 [Kribbella pratensis]TDX03875.1 hypothetical protein EV647_2121 [Kribbella sp. VKM Ac-2566]